MMTSEDLKNPYAEFFDRFTPAPVKESRKGETDFGGFIGVAERLGKQKADIDAASNRPDSSMSDISEKPHNDAGKQAYNYSGKAAQDIAIVTPSAFKLSVPGTGFAKDLGKLINDLSKDHPQPKTDKIGDKTVAIPLTGQIEVFTRARSASFEVAQYSLPVARVPFCTPGPTRINMPAFTEFSAF